MLVVVVLLGIFAGSTTTLFARLASQSAGTLRDRQALAFANGLLDEVRAMPFTYCDANDGRARVATRARLGALDCQTRVDAMGAEPGETRYNAANRFDGVSDYQNFAMPGPGCAGLCDIAGNQVNLNPSPLQGCNASVNLVPQALPGVAALDVDGQAQALRIVVRLACPGRADLVVEALRLRHSPRLN